MTDDVVRNSLKAMASLEVYESNELIRIVCGGARKVLAILILIGHVEYIKQFIEADQFQPSRLDHRLPFELLWLENRLKRPRAKLFYETQWEFTSPVFSESVLRRKFDDHTILPFTHENYIGKGGFGMVYEIEIDAEQSMYSEALPKVSEREEFEEEVTKFVPDSTQRIDAPFKRL